MGFLNYLALLTVTSFKEGLILKTKREGAVAMY
jgi:hypothetical protein